MSFVAFMKKEDGSGWARCRESLPIPRGIMLPDFVFPNRVDLPGGTESGIGTMTRLCLLRPPSALNCSPKRCGKPDWFASPVESHMLITCAVIPFLTLTMCQLH
jgi:hypothetical protein